MNLDAFAILISRHVVKPHIYMYIPYSLVSRGYSGEFPCITIIDRFCNEYINTCTCKTTAIFKVRCKEKVH